MSFLERMWYGPRGPFNHLCMLLLLPFSGLFAVLAGARRTAYRMGLLRQQQFDVPVIVVGNITVGGTGKTPIVLALIDQLRRAGRHPGVVSRGYGGRGPYPLTVTADTPAIHSGDEPALIAQRGRCPVVVDPERNRAVRNLLQHGDVDIVISDDGMQHYSMGRDFEIAVLDAGRRLGNGLLLPAGPLREPASRLESVDLVLVNGGDENEASIHMQLGEAVNLLSGKQRPLQEFAGTEVHAVAGIGHPERFFEQLRELGIHVLAHPKPDHYAYRADDLRFGNGQEARPVLMTEKDAVKCRDIAHGQCWYVPVAVQFNERAEAALQKIVYG